MKNLFLILLIISILSLQIIVAYPVDTTFKIPGWCGDGVKDSGEQCDINDFGGLTCGSYGYPSGELVCTAGCIIDFSGCYTPSGGGGGDYIPLTDEIIVEDIDPIVRMVVKLTKPIKNPSLGIEPLDELPLIEPKELLYKYINTTKINFDDSIIKNVTIDFRVNNSWIAGNGLIKIYLLEYETNWVKLQTELINKTGTHTYYKVYTKDLPYFAIVGEKEISICAETQKRCFNTNLELCVNNSWQSLETCEFGCNKLTMTCNLKPEEIPEIICTPGEKRCLNDNLQKCENNNWTTEEICAYGCNKTSLNCNIPEKIISVDKLKLIISANFPYLLLVLILILFGVVLYIIKKKLRVYEFRKYKEFKKEIPKEDKSIIEAGNRIQELEKKIEEMSLKGKDAREMKKDLKSAKYDLKLGLLVLAKYRLNRVVNRLKRKFDKNTD